jgi:hypothetical protein
MKDGTEEIAWFLDYMFSSRKKISNRGFACMEYVGQQNTIQSFELQSVPSTPALHV